MDVFVVNASSISNACIAFEVSSGNVRVKSFDEAWVKIEEIVERCETLEGSKKLELLMKATKYPQVLEHVYVTLLFVDVPTFVMWQLTRHRHISWMVSSHRHSLVPPEPSIPRTDRVDSRLEEAIHFIWRHGYRTYRQLVSEGYPMELARLVLPPVDSRTILATANLRAWLEMLCFRLNANTQEETKVLLEKILFRLDQVYNGLKDYFPQVCRNLYRHRQPNR